MATQSAMRSKVFDGRHSLRGAIETHNLAVQLAADRQDALNTRLLDLQHKIDEVTRENRRIDIDLAAASGRLREVLGVPPHAKLSQSGYAWVATWQPSRQELEAEAQAAIEAKADEEKAAKEAEEKAAAARREAEEASAKQQQAIKLVAAQQAAKAASDRKEKVRA